jgi:hypothetical protein
MAMLVAGFAPVHAIGDLFLIGDEALAAIDRLETGTAGAAGPYARAPVPVVASDGAGSWVAQAYVAREPDPWRDLVERDEAEALAAYPRPLADEVADKPCCVRAPGHPPPHDVIDPLAPGPARPGAPTS